MKRISVRSVLGMLGLLPAVVVAQNQAAAQQQEQIRQGYQHQQDMYAAQGQISTPASKPYPLGEWVKTWGGIAYSPSGDIGVAKGLFSRQEAEAAALRECSSAWGAGCKVSFVYFNQCVAISAPSGNDGMGRVVGGGFY